MVLLSRKCFWGVLAVLGRSLGGVGSGSRERRIDGTCVVANVLRRYVFTRCNSVIS